MVVILTPCFGIYCSDLTPIFFNGVQWVLRRFGGGRGGPTLRRRIGHIVHTPTGPRRVAESLQQRAAAYGLQNRRADPPTGRTPSDARAESGDGCAFSRLSWR